MLVVVFPLWKKKRTRFPFARKFSDRRKSANSRKERGMLPGPIVLKLRGEGSPKDEVVGCPSQSSFLPAVSTI